ncbi:hypothetical protein ACL07V_15685 [Streptomyces sp. MB22_4]|uniref:hypothetical protein n=1 Tax=Streptomyces sp. MB22_4 TaxID=3383120 RepID=UPI0039A07EE1
MDENKRRDLQGLKEFRKVLNRFQDASEAVRELSDFSERMSGEALKNSGSVDITIMPTLAAPSKEKAKEAAAALTDFFQGVKEALSNSSPEESPDKVRELAESMSDRLDAASTEDFDASKYIVETMTVYRRKNRRNVLRSSLLTSAVGDFEVLFSSLVGMYFQLRPQALSSKEPQFSWEDIQKFNSLEDLRAFHADRQVEQLMWKGFDDWMEWLEKKLKIKFADISLDADAVTEVFQRRHVIVHNGAKVSRQYLNKVPKPEKGLKVGQDLEVTREYLAAALDQLYVLGILMASAVADRLIRDDEVRSVMQNQLASVVEGAMRSGRWKTVARLCEIYTQTFDSEARKNSMRVNLWVARKEESGVEAIRSEVSSWDVSSLREEFELAKWTILDEFEEAHRLVCELAHRDVLSESEYLEDPLYAHLRDWVRETGQSSPFAERPKSDVSEITELVTEELKESGAASIEDEVDPEH